MLIFWLRKNWRLVPTACCGIFAVLTAALAVAHVYGPDMGSTVSFFRFFLFFAWTGGFAALFMSGKIDDGIQNLLSKYALYDGIGKLVDAPQKDLDLYRKFTRKVKPYLNENGPSGISALMSAVKCDDHVAARILIEEGANANLPVVIDAKQTLPLDWALRRGTFEMAKLLLQKTKTDEAFLRKYLISPVTVAIAQGNFDFIKNATLADLTLVGPEGWQPINFAIALGADKKVIDLFQEKGVKFTGIAKLTMTDGSIFELNPTEMAAALDRDAHCAHFISRGAPIYSGRSQLDAVIIAAMRALPLTLNAAEKIYDWDHIVDGLTAIQWAAKQKHNHIVSLISGFMNKRAKVNGAGAQTNTTATQTLATAQIVTPTAQSPVHGSTSRYHQIAESDIREALEMSLTGLVNMSDFTENFAQALFDFNENNPAKSRGIVLWGNASVGKSSVARRIAGVGSAGTTALKLDGISIHYISCADKNIKISEELKNIPERSVVFLDEIDKFLDPGAGIVSDIEAKRIKMEFVTNYDAKPILWVFLGTFQTVRGSDMLTSGLLHKLLGSELNSRVEVSPDWRLKSWDEQSIFEASTHNIPTEVGKCFDQESVMHLAEKALEVDGGYREFDKHVRAIHRRMQKSQSRPDPQITRKDTVMYFDHLEGKAS